MSNFEINSERLASASVSYSISNDDLVVMTLATADGKRHYHFTREGFTVFALQMMASIRRPGEPVMMETKQ